MRQVDPTPSTPEPVRRITVIEHCTLGLFGDQECPACPGHEVEGVNPEWDTWHKERLKDAVQCHAVTVAGHRCSKRARHVAPAGYLSALSDPGWYEPFCDMHQEIAERQQAAY